MYRRDRDDANIDCSCRGRPECVDRTRSSAIQSTSERDDGRTLSERQRIINGRRSATVDEWPSATRQRHIAVAITAPEPRHQHQRRRQVRPAILRSEPSSRQRRDRIVPGTSTSAPSRLTPPNFLAGVRRHNNERDVWTADIGLSSCLARALAFLQIRNALQRLACDVQPRVSSVHTIRVHWPCSQAVSAARRNGC